MVHMQGRGLLLQEPRFLGSGFGLWAIVLWIQGFLLVVWSLHVEPS